MHTSSILSFALAAAIALSIRSSSAFVLTGVTDGINNQTGARPFRQNILAMYNDTDRSHWELYLQAVQVFQDKNQTEQLSWFQVAGVHGYPAQNWDGVGATANPQTPGYAPHNAILFGPWHRAYLAAYEQLLVQNAQAIAAQYPAAQQAKYVEAAKTLRIPYWDWASNGGKMPGLVTNPYMLINTPKGKKSIPNPLVTFRFSQAGERDGFPHDFPVSDYPNTVRMPDANGQSTAYVINSQLNANFASLRDRVYNLLARTTQYALFSNTGYPAELRNGSYDNLENIHNQIHGMVGGPGHMGYVPFSAFDPIFWLHHANIDRILVLWETINPDSYVVPQQNDVGTWAEPAGTIEDTNTSLMPFHRDTVGNFHTATTARYPKSFGYAYPEVVDWNVSPAQLTLNVRAIVKTLYSTANSALAKRSVSRVMRRADDGQQRDWFINFSVKRNNNIPISVHFFLGNPPTDAASWSTASNLIQSQIVMPDMSLNSQGAPSIGQIPLSRSLSDAQRNGNLRAPDVVSVSSFIKDNLEWRVQSLTGEVIDAKTLTDLEISVVDQVVRHTDQEDRFEEVGQFNKHPELQWGN